MLAGIAPQAWANSGGGDFNDEGGNKAYGGQGSNNANVIFDDGSGSYFSAFGGYSCVDSWCSSGVDASGKADNNALTIASTGKVYAALGGAASSPGSYTSAVGNTLTVKGTVSHALGGASQSGPASDNQVFVEAGSTVDVRVTGGLTTYGNATGNTVTINGGTVQGNVFGSESRLGEAINNTVHISGTPDLSSATLYGGYNPIAGTDATTGNTLEVESKNLKVAGVQNFENITFTLPTGTTASDTVLIVNNAADLTGVNITVGGSIPKLAAGQKLTLISRVSGTPATSSGVPSGLVLDASSGALVLKAPPPPSPPVPGSATAVPTLGDIGLLLSGLALAGAAAPALRRRERRERKARGQD